MKISIYNIKKSYTFLLLFISVAIIQHCGGSLPLGIDEKLLQLINTTYSVHFYTEPNGTIVPTSKYQQTKAVTLPTQISESKLGYTFIGWHTDPNSTIPLEKLIMPAYDVNLYAIWKKSDTPPITQNNMYTITFNANGGTGIVPNNILVTSNNSILLLPPSHLEKIGYVFLGWATTNNTNNVLLANYIVTTNTTLYAVWTINTNITITFDTNGATGGTAPIALNNQTYNTIVTLPQQGTLVKEGYNFLGWATTNNSSTTVSNNYKIPANNTTLYAIWGYSITFNANGGASTPSTVYATPNSYITLPSSSLIRTNYKLLGWARISTATEALPPKYKVTNNSILYAVWTPTISLKTFNLSTFVIKADKTLYALGRNLSGQLGLGNNNNVTNFTQAKQIENGTTQNITSVWSIIIYDTSAFVIKQDGTLWVTGGNIAGELGLGNTTDQNIFTQAKQIENGTTQNITNVWSMATSHHSTFVVKKDGTLWATGYNNQGQLGLGNTTDQNHLTQVTSMSDVYSVVTNNNSTLVVKTDGTLWATGLNVDGQLGLGNTTNQNSFTQAKQTQSGTTQNITNVYSVVTNNSSTFVIKTDGTLWATGRNDGRQLGLGNTTNQNSFIEVTNNVSSVLLGDNVATFIIKKNQDLWVVGQNYNGQLGVAESTKETLFNLHPNIHSLVNSTGSTLLITTTNELWATGQNNNGTLGIGNTNNRYGFTNARDITDGTNTNISNVLLVVTNAEATFILRSDNTIWASGYNAGNPLGLSIWAANTITYFTQVPNF